MLTFAVVYDALPLWRRPYRVFSACPLSFSLRWFLPLVFVCSGVLLRSSSLSFQVMSRLSFLVVSFSPPLSHCLPAAEGKWASCAVLLRNLPADTPLTLASRVWVVECDGVPRSPVLPGVVASPTCFAVVSSVYLVPLMVPATPAWAVAVPKRLAVGMLMFVPAHYELRRLYSKCTHSPAVFSPR